MNDLKHFGVLGMKWGIRKRVSSSDHAKVRSILKTKKLHEMSNEELKAVNNRLQLERSYKDLSKKQASRGSKIVTSLLVGLGTRAINSYVSGKAANDPIFQNFVKVVKELKNRRKTS